MAKPVKGHFQYGIHRRCVALTYTVFYRYGGLEGHWPAFQELECDFDTREQCLSVVRLMRELCR